MSIISLTIIGSCIKTSKKACLTIIVLSKVDHLSVYISSQGLRIGLPPEGNNALKAYIAFAK
jgi:hypothetical protein